MNFKFILFIMISSAFLVSAEDHRSNRNPNQEMFDMMKNILVDNSKFRHDTTDEVFQREASGQQPRCTIVGCADSRVHTSNFDFHPLGDVFFIRNIGNQFETCLGSIDYGVYHLNTPVLIFLGHSKCGAVTAVTQGIDDLERSIQSELAPMQVIHKTPAPTEEQIADNVAENVKNQVAKAYKRYRKLIKHHKLWVIGAVYDFTLEKRGEFSIIQVNNHTNKAEIAEFLKLVNRNGNYYNDPGRP